MSNPSRRPGWTAVVLTGGRSSRLGRDKAYEHVGGEPLLQRVLGAVPAGVPLVIVGPQPAPPLARPVLVTRESPPGGGPAAALAAALPLVRTDVLVALATDLPFLGGLPQQLAARLADSDADAVVPTDPSGRDQPLSAAYRTRALRLAASRSGDLHGAPLRSLLADLRVARLRPRTDTVDPTMDIDTPADLERAQGAAMMQDWIDAVRLDLNTSAEVDLDVVLEVARDVAHNVQRPAAPVTTYLLGIAVGSGMPLHEAAAKIHELASGWRAE